MLNAWIEGIGLLGPGLNSWPQALAVLPRLLQALRGQRLRSVPLNEAFKGGEAVCPLDKVAA